MSSVIFLGNSTKPILVKYDNHCIVDSSDLFAFSSKNALFLISPNYLFMYAIDSSTLKPKVMQSKTNLSR